MTFWDGLLRKLFAMAFAMAFAMTAAAGNRSATPSAWTAIVTEPTKLTILLRLNRTTSKTLLAAAPFRTAQ